MPKSRAPGEEKKTTEFNESHLLVRALSQRHRPTNLFLYRCFCHQFFQRLQDDYDDDDDGDGGGGGDSEDNECHRTEVTYY